MANVQAGGTQLPLLLYCLAFLIPSIVLLFNDFHQPQNTGQYGLDIEADAGNQMGDGCYDGDDHRLHMDHVGGPHDADTQNETA